MLSLPNDVLDSALTLLVSGITSFDDESPGESTPLAQLSQKARTLDFIMQAFHSHIQKRILPVRRQFNKLLPISKLPDELLQEIFLYACVASDGLARYRTPTILAAVSLRWRSVAIWYPQLWNSMHSDLGVEFTKLMLQRSKSAPVDLFCSCSSKDRANRFFDLLIPQSMRWRTLEFSYSNFAKLSLDFLAGQSFPLLERVILPQHERGPFYGIIHHLNLNIVAPSIKVFEAPKHPLCLHLDHSIPSMLTTLSFTASINSVPFVPSDYYKLLTSTPYLQHLFIRGFLNDVSPDPDVTEPMRIDLPHLNTLRLEGLRYKTIGFLLSSIVTLPNGYPDVEVRDKLFGSLSTMFSLSPQEDSLLAGFSHSNQAVLMSLGASVGVSLELEAADGKKTLLNLIPHESASPVEDLSIIVTVLLPVIRQLEIDGLEILWLGLVDKLHLLPRLEKIRIRSEEEDDNYADREDALVRTIALIASSSPPQSPQVICPLLRHFTLDTFSFDMRYLVELVLARTPEKDEEWENGGRLELVELGEKFDLDTHAVKLLHQLAADRNFELRVGELSEW